MSKEIDFKNLSPRIKKAVSSWSKHASFTVVLLILVIYIFSVWRISQLASAEPTPEQEAAAIIQTPKIDASAIKQIEALEQSNTEVKSLFNSARNNPFQE